MGFSISSIKAFCETSGVKSILQTKPIAKLETCGLKYAQKLEGDVVQIKQCDYRDIINNMLKQRSRITNNNRPLMQPELRLAQYKDNYIGLNRRIREDIRGEDALNRYDQADLKELDDLISQSSIPRNTTLYRGATPYDFGLDQLNSSGFISKFYKKGRCFNIPIYPETSLEKSIGEDFARNKILFKINTPKGTKGIYMEGLPVQSTNYGNEQEILLPRNLIYKFKNLTQCDNYSMIELDILPKKPFWKKIFSFNQ